MLHMSSDRGCWPSCCSCICCIHCLSSWNCNCIEFTSMAAVMAVVVLLAAWHQSRFYQDLLGNDITYGSFSEISMNQFYQNLPIERLAFWSSLSFHAVYSAVCSPGSEPEQQLTSPRQTVSTRVIAYGKLPTNLTWDLTTETRPDRKSASLSTGVESARDCDLTAFIFTGFGMETLLGCYLAKASQHSFDSQTSRPKSRSCFCWFAVVMV